MSDFRLNPTPQPLPEYREGEQYKGAMRESAGSESPILNGDSYAAHDTAAVRPKLAEHDAGGTPELSDSFH